MTDEDKNLLNSSEFYLLLSKRTKRPYITEECVSYCFESTNAAEATLKSFPDVELGDPEIVEQKMILTDIFCRGAEKMTIVFRNGEQKIIELSLDDFPVGNYNIDTCRAFALALQTNKKKYLRELLSLPIYIPISTPGRKKGFYPQIEYMGATTSSETYFLAFTSLDEYSKWIKKTEVNTGALCTPLHTLNKLRKKRSVIINPASEKLILTDEMMRTKL